MVDRSLSLLHCSEPTLLDSDGGINLEEGGRASGIEDISVIIADLLEAISEGVDGDTREHGGDNGEDSDDPLNKVIDNSDIDALELLGIIAEEVTANLLTDALVASELLMVAGGLVLFLAGVVERSLSLISSSLLGVCLPIAIFRQQLLTLLLLLNVFWLALFYLSRSVSFLTVPSPSPSRSVQVFSTDSFKRRSA